MRIANPSIIRRLSVGTTVALLAAGLAACGGSHHSTAGSSSQVKASATATASAADTQLAADGYTATHVPGFGDWDLGIRNAAPKYEVVFTYKGSNPALMTSVVTSAKQKLPGNDGVTIKVVGSDLIVVTADKLHDLETAGKAVLKGMK